MSRVRKAITGVALLMTAAIASGGAHAQSGPQNVTMIFENLAPLDEAVEGHYEGWAMVNGSPVSTGVFNVDAQGAPVELNGGGAISEFDAGVDISEATAIIITLEPPQDNDPDPSEIKMMFGAVSGAEAPLMLNVPDRAVIEASTTGAFILATPSDNPGVPDNDDMGIWYLTVPGPAPGFLNLPDIGPNWIYEGWIVDLTDPSNPVPYSTGTFSMASAADSDAAGCNGGGPPFPGQDFVAFHCGPILDLDTGNFAAVISIEPTPDNLPGPFQVKPMLAMIPTDALGRNNDLTNQASATFPVGTARLYDETTATRESSWGQVRGLFR